MTRAQGALEYLLLLGGAITVAAIIIAIVLGLGSVGSGNAYNLFASAEAKKLSAQKGVDLTGLKGYYKFDGDFKDYSGWNNHGTISGPYEFRNGKIGQAIYFPDSAGFVSIKATALNGLGDFTIIFWFNEPVSRNSNIINATSGAKSTILRKDLDYIETTLTQSTGTFTYSRFNTGSISPNVFHYLALVRSGANQTVYYDCTTILPNSPGNPTISDALSVDTIKIGQFNQGSLDEVYILGRAMLQADISRLAGC